MDAVLALDRPEMLAGAYVLRELRGRLEIGPFRAETRLLPHTVPNAGVRLTAAGRSIAYTGDSGPSPEVAVLARDADVLVAEATFVDQVPPGARPYLSSARVAGRQAAAAGAGRLLLTHLQPGTDPAAARAAAGATYGNEADVATADLVVDLG